MIMKKVLLPTDFSPISINAIQYATRLFKDVPCTFYLLNVFRIPYLTNEELMDQNASNLTLVEDEMFQSSRKEIEKILLEIPPNENHNFQMISDYNLFSLAVEQVVKEKDIELIIMGTKGISGAKEIFMGSNASDVILRNSCHVIAVPEHNEFKSPKELVFPTDYLIDYNFIDLAPLVSLAELSNAMVRIVHFTDKDDLNDTQMRNKRKLETYLESINHSYHTLSNNDFEEGLNCFTQSRGNIDMIVIMARHYSFFERLFFKPKVRALSFHAKIPLFVIHHVSD